MNHLSLRLTKDAFPGSLYFRHPHPTKKLRPTFLHGCIAKGLNLLRTNECVTEQHQTELQQGVVELDFQQGRVDVDLQQATKYLHHFSWQNMVKSNKNRWIFDGASPSTFECAGSSADRSFAEVWHRCARRARCKGTSRPSLEEREDR